LNLAVISSTNGTEKIPFHIPRAKETSRLHKLCLTLTWPKAGLGLDAVKLLSKKKLILE
jgi:hypothetical protein